MSVFKQSVKALGVGRSGLPTAAPLVSLFSDSLPYLFPQRWPQRRMTNTGELPQQLA